MYACCVPATIRPGVYAGGSSPDAVLEAQIIGVVLFHAGAIGGLTVT